MHEPACTYARSVDQFFFWTENWQNFTFRFINILARQDFLWPCKPMMQPCRDPKFSMKYLQQFDKFFEFFKFLFHFLFYYFDKTRLDLALQANDATDSRSQITLTHVKAAFVLNTSSSQSSFWLHTALHSGRDSFAKKMLCTVVVFRAKNNFKAPFVLKTSLSQSSFWLHNAMHNGRECFAKTLHSCVQRKIVVFG